MSIDFATPAVLTAQPLGARLPLSIDRPPVFEYGLSMVWITSVFLIDALATFWLMVFPVTVMQSGFIRPGIFEISLMIALIPPAASTSSMCQWLEGETLQMLGHFAEMLFILSRS